MNDEIKEIRDILFELQFLGNDTQLKVVKLNDYITNLQQENKEWEMIFDTFSKRPYAHKYLEEKRKELGNDKIIGLDSEMIYKDYYDYKSRCEKADSLLELKQLRYLNEDSYRICTLDLQEVRDILQNGSDSE